METTVICTRVSGRTSDGTVMLGCGVRGVGFGVWGVGFGVQCLGFEGKGYRVETTVICTSVSGRTSDETGFCVFVFCVVFYVLCVAIEDRGLRVQGGDHSDLYECVREDVRWHSHVEALVHRRPG